MKVISGAQEGADIAGLDAAKHVGFETGGWVPKGGRQDTGCLSATQIAHYSLKVTEWSSAYPPRTELNVKDSDGTVLFGNIYSPGCKLTVRLCRDNNKPFILNPTLDEFLTWLVENKIEVLNVAGNRERTNPGIYRRTFDFLVEAFKRSSYEIRA